MMNEGKLSIPFFPDTEDICQSTKQLTNMICHTDAHSFLGGPALICIDADVSWKKPAFTARKRTGTVL